jgi:hAT family C-terminal dimerisation region
MLERMLEQRQAIALYAAENDSLCTLSPQQWDIMKNVVGLLGPFEEATRYVSSATVCISETIPLLAGLKSRLEKAQDDAGVKTMKAALLEALASRFQIDYSPVYTIASVLDPRFKTRFFNDVVSAAVVGDVKTKLAAMMNVVQTNESDRPDTTEQQLPKKVPKLTSKASLFDCLDDLLEAATPQDTQATQSTPAANASTLELDHYLAEPLIPRTNSLSQWWRENKDKFPILASLARTYLGAPPSSVPSERLFSTAGAVITDQRSRLLPDNAEMLIFLKYNSILIE